MSSEVLYKSTLTVDTQSAISYRCDNPYYDYNERLYPYSPNSSSLNYNRLVIGSDNFLLGSGNNTDFNWRDQYVSADISKRNNPYIINGCLVDRGSNSFDSDIYVTTDPQTGINTLTYPQEYYNEWEAEYGYDNWICWVYLKKECIGGTCQKIRFNSFAYLALQEPCEGYPDIIKIKEIGVKLNSSENGYRMYFLEGESETEHLSHREIPTHQAFTPQRWKTSCVYFLPNLHPLSYNELMHMTSVISENETARTFIQNNCLYGGAYVGAFEANRVYCDKDLLVAKLSRPYPIDSYSRYRDYEKYYSDLYLGDATTPYLTISSTEFPELDTPSWVDEQGLTHHPEYYLFIPFDNEDEFNAAKSANYFWASNTEQMFYLENMNMSRERYEY